MTTQCDYIVSTTFENQQGTIETFVALIKYLPLLDAVEQFEDYVKELKLNPLSPLCFTPV